MAKLAAISNKKLWWIAGASATITVAVLLIVFRVWIHETIFPGVTGIFYERGVQDSVVSQNAALGDPFANVLPGGKNIKKNSECYTSYSRGIQTLVVCHADMREYAELGQTADAKAKVLAAVKKTEAALKSQGYQAGGNGVTLTSLVGGTYEGKDYSPDAFYEKNAADGKYCMFDAQVAYSNPEPAAMFMQLSCERTIKVFGDPGQPDYAQPLPL